MDHNVTVRTVTMVSVCRHSDGLMSLSFSDENSNDVTAYLTAEQVDDLLAKIVARRPSKPNWNQTPAEVRADKDALRCVDMPDGDCGEGEDNVCDS